MHKETLFEEIKLGVSSLVEMAKDICWNEIRSPYQYIITNIVDYEGGNGADRRTKRNKINSLKNPASLEKVIKQLENIYSDLYDINICVYHAHERGTVFEIRYYPKSALDPEFFNTIKENSPMLHMKIAEPHFWAKGNAKFDINWEYNKGF